MRISRIYVAQALSRQATITLTGKHHHYLAHVLRLSTGDTVCLFNGDGNEYQCSLRTVTRHNAELLCESVSANVLESPIAIELFLAIAKSHSMDFALQKATELGVCTVQLVITEYSQPSTRRDFKKKLQHWHQVVISAAEQCERAVVPVVQPPITLAEIQPAAGASLCALIPGATESFVAKLQKLQEQQPQRIVLLIGPEGDFSERDKAIIARLGFSAVHIGSRILRVETATLTAIALVQAMLGDFV